MFKLWSQIKKEVKNELKPDFGFRSWNDLEEDDKKKIWLYLWKEWFFNIDEYNPNRFFSYEEYRTNKERDKNDKLFRIIDVLDVLNCAYKAKTYARKFLESRNPDNALDDFLHIYLKETESVVFELLSIYAQILINNENDLKKKDDESGDDFNKRKDIYKWKKFDEFVEDLNDKFEHFGIYVFLTRQGFAPRQDDKIIEDIYNPVLKMLSSSEYKKVNISLEKTFENFRKPDYDKVIQNSINTIHAYLQIKLDKKDGKGNFKSLLRESQKKKIIPYEGLIVDLYNNIESFLARERKEKTTAHPSYKEANIDDASFVLNLTMLILQSFLNFQK